MLSLCPLLREVSWQQRVSVTGGLASSIEKGIPSSLSQQNGGGAGIFAMALGGEGLVEGGWKFEIQPSSRGDDVGTRLGMRGTRSGCVAADIALKREIGALGGDDGWEAPLRGSF
ncbi:hypothetical protein ACLB2K_062466 [Fragaria x ananassa]